MLYTYGTTDKLALPKNSAVMTQPVCNWNYKLSREGKKELEALRHARKAA